MAADTSSSIRQVVFQTATFLVAWSWVLVYYGASHALVGESPLDNQVAFGGQGQQKSLLKLALQYLVVCSCCAAFAGRVKSERTGAAVALVAAVEFFPSPVFSGKLLSYLGQFGSGGALRLCLLNLAASWAVAAIVYAAPTAGRFGELFTVVRGTVGFGLGVAWNVVVSRSEPVQEHLAARTVYVLVVVLVAVRLSAPEPQQDCFRERHAALMSFASRVVCAFALADWLAATFPDGLVGGLCSLAAVILLAAVLSAALARADLERQMQRARALEGTKGWEVRFLRCLVMVPCVWCCCPWVPLVWLLSGNRKGVKDRWLRLTADVTSLAASVVGTNVLTGVVDRVAAREGICGGDSPCYPFAFVLFEAAAAAIASLILLAIAAPLAELPAPEAIGGRDALLDAV